MQGKDTRRALAGNLHILCNCLVPEPWSTGPCQMQILLDLYMDSPPPQEPQQQQNSMAGSSASSAAWRHAHAAGAATQAVSLGAQQADPLSLPVHEVLGQLLITSIMRQHTVYARAILTALQKLDEDVQPGAYTFCISASCVAHAGWHKNLVRHPESAEHA